MKKQTLKQQKKIYKEKLEKLKTAREKKEVKHFVNAKTTAIEKPEHEKKKPLFILAIVLGVLANLLSGVTEYSKVYSFCLDILGSLFLASGLATVITAVFIAGLELANRFLGKSYFEELAENEEHTSNMNGKLVLMLALSGLSIWLSFGGSFDLIKLAKNPPTLSQATLNTKEGIDATYNKLIEEAKSDAEKYKESRLYRGKLQKSDTRRYNELVDKKLALVNEHSLALKNLRIDNAAEEERVEKQNDKKNAKHTASINNQGYGLGFITILSILSLYLCLWYEAGYRQKKKEYLEEKYQAEFDEEEEDNNQDDVEEIAFLQKKLQQLETMLQQYQTPQNNHLPTPGPNNQNNFIAPPGYYQYPTAHYPTKDNRVEVKGFLSGANRINHDVDAVTGTSPENDVSQWDTTPDNQPETKDKDADIKIVDLKALMGHINKCYIRSFLHTKLNISESKSLETCEKNKGRVLDKIPVLNKCGWDVRINFEEYEKPDFFQIESQPA